MCGLSLVDSVIFFSFILQAKKEKEREERERRKGKHGRDKERGGREREKEENLMEGPSEVHVDMGEIHDENENKRSGKFDNKHRKLHRSSVDNLSESEKDRTKNSYRHSSDHIKSKKV